MRSSQQTAQTIEGIRHKVPDGVVASRYGMFPSRIRGIKQLIDVYDGYEEGPDFSKDKNEEEPAMMTVKEVAAMLRISTRTLGEWRRKGKGPKAIKLGYNKVVFPEKGVHEWLKDKEDDVC